MLFCTTDYRLLATDRFFIFVCNPPHYLRIGIHVGSRHIQRWADDERKLPSKLARKLFKLTRRKFLWVYAHAALAAAKRYINDCALHRHEKRECFYLLHIYALVIPNATFVCSEYIVVLYTVPVKYALAPVIHFYGDGYFYGTVGHKQRR